MTTKMKKTLNGLGIALIGMALTYATERASGTDFGAYGPLVTALLSAAWNGYREHFLKDDAPAPVPPAPPSG